MFKNTFEKEKEQDSLLDNSVFNLSSKQLVPDST